MTERQFTLLDLFCGAGGAAMGYHQAGFQVIGVDINPQPRYPFEFVQRDALEYARKHGTEFDAIHASPPCQFASVMSARWKDKTHINLIPATRDVLKSISNTYIIENVAGARQYLINPVMLCGTMFGLGSCGAQLLRHRYFECSFGFFITPLCNHNKLSSAIGVYGGAQHPKRRKTIGVYGSTGGYSKRDGHKAFSISARREAMQIDWMTGAELSQAIPPAYTKYIGEHLIKFLKENTR